MKLNSLLCLVVALCIFSPLLAQAQPTGAYGVSFTVPEGWTVNQQVDPAWTKFHLSQGGGLPKVMIQIYSGRVQPVSALNAYVDAHRAKYRERHWPFTQTPTQEAFGRRVYDGRALIYTANDSNYSQRFFAFTLNDRTVLVTSTARMQANWNYWNQWSSGAPDVLGPIASTFQ